MAKNKNKLENNKMDYLKSIREKYGIKSNIADGGWPYSGQPGQNRFQIPNNNLSFLEEQDSNILDPYNPNSNNPVLGLPNQTNNYQSWGQNYQQPFEAKYADKDFANYFGKENSNKSQSAARPNSLKNMKGMETAGEIPEGSVAQAKTDIAGSVFNAVGTGLESFAPPDSKFGKAMQKGNSFAKTAEPLKMLDMAVPGLGTGLVEAARLAGAITGGIQAKNEEIDTDRIEENTNFLKKYQNFNFDKVSQGNRMAEEGYNVQGNNDQLIQEIFQDFDNLLGIQEPPMRYGGKLYARDGYNLTNTYSNYPDPTVVPSYTPSGVLGIQGKSPEQAQEIASYMDFNQDELYQFKDNDSMKDLIPINTPGYTASRLNPIYRKMPNSKQYIPLSKQQYNKGLSFIE